MVYSSRGECRSGATLFRMIRPDGMNVVMQVVWHGELMRRPLERISADVESQIVSVTCRHAAPDGIPCLPTMAVNKTVEHRATGTTRRQGVEPGRALTRASRTPLPEETR